MLRTTESEYLMVKDFAALQTELEKPRYDAAVRGKSLQPLMALLNEEDSAGTFLFSDVPVADVIEAAGPAKLKALTQEERDRLVVLKDEGMVALSRPGIRAELLDVFGITETQLATAIPEVRRRPAFGEAFGFQRVTKRDLWKILPDISKSYMAQYLARG